MIASYVLPDPLPSHFLPASGHNFWCDQTPPDPFMISLLKNHSKVMLKMEDEKEVSDSWKQGQQELLF